MKHFLSAILCGLFAVVLVSCEKEKSVEVTSVSLSQATAEMYIGETTTLSAKVLPNDATDKTVTWASSKLSVATVSSSGMVTAIAEGISTITASAGGKSATCTVTVSKKVIAVSSVELNKSNLSMVVGDTETLTATVKPDDATDNTVLWSSSDNSVATVDNGKITALKEGSTTIIAKAGDRQASCSVIVAKKIIEVTNVTLNKTELDLIKGASETLSATVYPEDATDKSVSWTSSNTDVASVTQEGKVTAVGGGTATITAKAGEQSATCAVSVTVPVESVQLNQSTLTLEEGQSASLVATVKPNDATDKSVSWTSSNQGVASVDQNGKVTAIQEGSTIITVKAGDKDAKCTVAVTKKTIPVTSITLNKTTLALNKYETETLIATVKPDNATDKTVKWESSKTAVASIDESGKITANAGGTAIITAKSGECSATCTVTVTVPVEGIALNTGSITLEVGKTTVLTATVYPSDATDKSVEWKSSEPGVASVDQEGKVEAKHTGNTVITARAGAEEVTCNVTVVSAAISIEEIYSLPDGTQVGTNPVLVVAKTSYGIMVAEDGHYMYLSALSLPAIVGDMVKFRAMKSTTRGLPELSSVESFETVSTGNPVSYPSATDITDVSVVNSSVFPFNGYNYVSVTATLTDMKVDDQNRASYYLKFHNIDPSVHVVDVMYPYDYQDYSNYVIGDEIKVTGYFAGLTTYNPYAIVIATSMTKIKTVPEGAVDLGLSVMWATHNIGTQEIGAWGDYYAWGEIEPKEYYGWNYKWAQEDGKGFTKYNVKQGYGTVDNLTRLEPEDDVAHVRMGGRWRMPTEKEVRELIDYCSIEYIENFNNTGRQGFKFTSRVAGYTDKWIFFPIAGSMAFSEIVGKDSWMTIQTADLDVDEPFSQVYLSCNKTNTAPYYKIAIEKGDTGMGRLAGHQVRGVFAY